MESSKHHSRCSCTSLFGIERDMIAVWPPGDEFCGSNELVDLLVEAFPDVWSAASCYGRNLTTQRLGRYLANECGLRSTRNSEKLRGYCRKDVQRLVAPDAW